MTGWFRWGLLTLLLGVSVCRVYGAGDPPAKAPTPAGRMTVMVSDSMFATVNRTDAMTSMKIYVDALARRRNLKFDSRIEIFSTVEEAAKALQEKSVDLFVLDTIDYAQLTKTYPIDVVAVGSMNGRVPTHEYVLLVRDPAIKDLAGLAGKSLLISSRTRAQFGAAWMESLLAENHLGRMKAHFANVSLGNRPSSCLLPLFFGKADACVVDTLNYDLMKELNPQLAKLTPIVRSEPLFEGMVAMPRDSHPFRNEVVDSILELHKYPTGDQLMMVFRVGPMVRVPQGVIDQVRRLYQRIFRLEGSGAKRAAGSRREPAGSGAISQAEDR